MLDHHYATEKSLPNDATALCRIVGAVSKAERDAVKSVLKQFWRESLDGWVNDRAMLEMGKADHQREVNRAIAESRESKRMVARTEHESCGVRSTNDEPNQTPDTRHQTKEGKTKPSAFALPAWIPPDVWGEWMPIRTAKKATNTPYALGLIVAKLGRWRAEGHDVQAILQTSIVGGWSDVYEPKSFMSRKVAPDVKRRAAIEEFVQKGDVIEAH